MGVVLSFSPKRSLPNGGVRIDWSHPMTNGLIGCYLPGITRGIDLCGNVNLTASSGATFDSTTPEGPGMLAGTAATRSGMTGPASGYPSNLDRWFFAVLARHGARG